MTALSSSLAYDAKEKVSFSLAHISYIIYHISEQGPIKRNSDIKRISPERKLPLTISIHRGRRRSPEVFGTDPKITIIFLISSIGHSVFFDIYILLFHF